MIGPLSEYLEALYWENAIDIEPWSAKAWRKKNAVE